MLLPWRHSSVGGCTSQCFLICMCRGGQTIQPVYWSLLTWLGGWWVASQLLFRSCLSREEAALDCEEQTLPRGRKGAAEIVTVESWLYHRQFASSEEHLKTGGFRILGSVCHSAFPDGIGYWGRKRAHIPVHLFHSKGTLSISLTGHNGYANWMRRPHFQRSSIVPFHFLLELLKIMSASEIITLKSGRHVIECKLHNWVWVLITKKGHGAGK